MKEITIVVNKSGAVHLDFNGFVGNECFKEREKLRELLKQYGLELEIEYEEKKPEAYISQKEEVEL